MSAQPAGFHFEVDPASDLPLWVQLRQRLIFLIDSGHYHPGDQLPTVRSLASDLSINYNTVNKAYLNLIHDGYLTSTRGRGVFVSTLDDETAGAPQQAAETLVDDFLEAAHELGLSTEDIRKLLAKRMRLHEKQRMVNVDEAQHEL